MCLPIHLCFISCMRFVLYCERHMIFVLLGMVYFIQHIGIQLELLCCQWQVLIIFNGQVVFHEVNASVSFSTETVDIHLLIRSLKGCNCWSDIRRDLGHKCIRNSIILTQLTEPVIHCYAGALVGCWLRSRSWGLEPMFPCGELPSQDMV